MTGSHFCMSCLLLNTHHIFEIRKIYEEIGIGIKVRAQTADTGAWK